MAKKITDLRETLFDIIDQVQSGKMDIGKAKTITNIAQVLVNTAKVEVDFLNKVNQQGNTGFISNDGLKKLN
ncbi:MAG: hypothetical protein KW793_03850 [Candidatus Doudnabacteria bacterium]|nr:hypothetical protein [Candidatus Doudnabacteria bacterium]